VRRDRCGRCGGEARGPVVGVRVPGPGREPGVGAGQQWDQRGPQVVRAGVEARVGQAQPRHGNVAQPLSPQRGVEFGAADAGQLGPGRRIQFGVGGLAVGGDHERELGPGRVQRPHHAAGAERLVVGMGGHHHHPPMRRRVEGGGPVPFEGIGPVRGRCDDTGSHDVTRAARTALPSAAWSRSP